MIPFDKLEKSTGEEFILSRQMSLKVSSGIRVEGRRKIKK